MTAYLRKLSIIPAALMVVGMLGGCTDETIIYKEFPLYDDPVDAALGFIGYSKADEKLVVCGNCHVEKQGGWENTGHAEAWETLQASGHAQAVCEGCHSVGQNGNVIDEAAGYEATGEERYFDVQCEACHGPGLEHVQNPKDATVPLAPLNVGADATLTGGCGECHSDPTDGGHHPFVDEWAQSRHGDASEHKDYREREGCDGCHGGEGALRAWGVNTEYLEKGQGDQIGITCAVCHDPHSDANAHQLRWPIDNRDVDQNLCMKCHQRRAVPDPTSSRGPHSPQGPLLLGQDVGWIPPNFAYPDSLFEDGAIRGTHGSEANQELCATCHLNSYEVTDAVTGDFLFSATGHLFKPIPCVDANGIPTGDDSCPVSTADRSFDSCVSAGCHGDENAALLAMLTGQGRIANLVAELDALLAQVDPGEFDTSDGVITVAEGANFNAGLGEIPSSAVHNPFLTEALLTSSIQAVQDEYGPFPLLNAGIELSNVLYKESRGGN
jgi:predicted CXXCH cytochrome family protein